MHSHQAGVFHWQRRGTVRRATQCPSGLNVVGCTHRKSRGCFLTQVKVARPRVGWHWQLACDFRHSQETKPAVASAAAATSAASPAAAAAGASVSLEGITGLPAVASGLPVGQQSLFLPASRGSEGLLLARCPSSLLDKITEDP